MLDDQALILASIGTATGAVALFRRRTRRARIARASWPVPVGVGARHLADALCAAATEPLRIAGPHWKSLAEMVQVQAGNRLD
jgi:hypothetical protein